MMYTSIAVKTRPTSSRMPSVRQKVLPPLGEAGGRGARQVV